MLSGRGPDTSPPKSLKDRMKFFEAEVERVKPKQPTVGRVSVAKPGESSINGVLDPISLPRRTTVSNTKCQVTGDHRTRPTRVRPPPIENRDQDKDSGVSCTLSDDQNLSDGDENPLPSPGTVPADKELSALKKTSTRYSPEPLESQSTRKRSRGSRRTSEDRVNQELALINEELEKVERERKTSIIDQFTPSPTDTVDHQGSFESVECELREFGEALGVEEVVLQLGDVTDQPAVSSVVVPKAVSSSSVVVPERKQKKLKPARKAKVAKELETKETESKIVKRVKTPEPKQNVSLKPDNMETENESLPEKTTDARKSRLIIPETSEISSKLVLAVRAVEIPVTSEEPIPSEDIPEMNLEPQKNHQENPLVSLKQETPIPTVTSCEAVSDFLTETDDRCEATCDSSQSRPPCFEEEEGVCVQDVENYRVVIEQNEHFSVLPSIVEETNQLVEEQVNMFSCDIIILLMIIDVT
eukprot:sb/3479378/